MNVKKMGIAFQLAVAGCVILFCSASASAQDVRYNFVAGTDFSKHKTYKWVQVPDAKYLDQILDGQIKQAIDTELSKKGLTRIVEDNADLYVAYQIAINQQTQWNAYGTGTATTTSSTINIGTLNLDLYDVAAKEQVWRGEATRTLKPSKNQQKNLANLQKAMAKLLKNYPPPTK